MLANLESPVHELDERVNGGAKVRLFWCESDGHVFVSVNDRTTGDSFTIDVPDGARALEVFNHPYVYARRP